jgi:hypothetical protein
MASFDPTSIPATTTVTTEAVGIGGVVRTISVTATWSAHIWIKSSLAGVLSLAVTLDGERAYGSTVEVFPDGRAVSQNMAYSDRARFAGMGMPEAAILVARQVLGVPIYSSSNNAAEWWLESELRIPEARKVWERLVGRGASPPGPGSDRFVLM